MMGERGVAVDYTTLYRWVQHYAPELEKRALWYQNRISFSWRVDETCVRVKGRWKYLYRAIDKGGRTLDFLLTDRCNTKATKWFLAKALRRSRDATCRRSERSDVSKTVVSKMPHGRPLNVIAKVVFNRVSQRSSVGGGGSY